MSRSKSACKMLGLNSGLGVKNKEKVNKLFKYNVPLSVISEVLEIPLQLVETYAEASDELAIPENLLDMCDKILSSGIAFEELGDIVGYTTHVLTRSYESRVLSDKKGRELLRGLREELKLYECPITGTLINKPAVAGDGFTYEFDAIDEWFNGSTTSPMTRQEIALTYIDCKRKIFRNPKFESEIKCFAAIRMRDLNILIKTFHNSKNHVLFGELVEIAADLMHVYFPNDTIEPLYDVILTLISIEKLKYLTNKLDRRTLDKVITALRSKEPEVANHILNIARGPSTPRQSSSRLESSFSKRH